MMFFRQSRMARFGAIIAGGVMLCTASVANAGTIFDNGAPDHVTGSISDFDEPQQIGDDFTFQSTQVLRDVHWWGVYANTDTPPALDNFTIRIFTITAGTPEMTPSVLDLNVGNVGRNPTGHVVVAGGFNFTEYAYWVHIPGVPISAGTYLLSIVNDTPQDTDDNWGWNTAPLLCCNTSFARNLDTDNWSPTSDMRYAFFLTDDIPVPEPGTLALFGLGLVGLGLARRKRAA